MTALLLEQRNFTVETSQERVWRLIGKVIFSCLPGMENIEILDENNFRAILKAQVLGFLVPMKMTGEIVEMEPPDSFAVKIFLEGPGRLFKAEQKVAFIMAPMEEGKTSVTCKATGENLKFLPRLFLIGQARRFSRSTFEAIEKRLKEWA
jgi:carbon monoxide dehydrogenase subunit G